MLGTVAIFVPAISAKKIEKALTLDVDTIYFDLEDSVAPAQKPEARRRLASLLEKLPPGRQSLAVRINGVGTPFWEEDLQAVALLPAVSGILLPNASREAVRTLCHRLEALGARTGVVALLETPQGIEEAAEIAQVRQVRAFQFGAEDYTASMGIQRTAAGEELRYVRARLSNVAHAYGLEALDTPYPAIEDLEALRLDTLQAKQLGFTGKAVIHPSHVAVIRELYRPSPQEVEQALRLLDAYGAQSGERAGVFAFNGRMVDAPILERARNVLRQAGL